jgi:hypothetical protein
VEVVAGPFEWKLGYIDDETNVELESEAGEYVSQCQEDELETPEGQSPWSVGPAWAIVYLEGLLNDEFEVLPGYNLILLPHLHVPTRLRGARQDANNGRGPHHRLLQVHRLS